MKYIGALFLVISAVLSPHLQARAKDQSSRRNVISRSMQEDEERQARRKEAMQGRTNRPRQRISNVPQSQGMRESAIQGFNHQPALAPAVTQSQQADAVQQNTSVEQPKKMAEKPEIKVDHSFGTQAVLPESTATSFDEKENHSQVQSAIDSSHSAILKQKNAETFNKVFFNFENVDLQNVADFVEKTHKVKFITSDVVTGQAVVGQNQQQQVAVTFAGHKVSYRSHVALSKKESWDLFLTFLHMAGFALVPMAVPDYYQVVPLLASATEVIPTFIGLHPDALPDNDMVIRYIYFMENLDPSVVKPLITRLQGNKNSIETYTELRALLFSDKSRNIKAIMKIIKELDKATLPQAMSVLKLQRANAEDVKKLYNSLRSQGTDPNQRAWLPQYKETTVQYFPKEAVISSDPRTNSLIILGPKDAVKRIEDFIIKYIDVELDAKSMPIYNYQLQYTKATDVKASLDSVLSYSASSTASQFGGVRDGYKYLQPVNIVADAYSNSLIINAHPEDYEIVLDLIKTLDRPQKQVAIELLIINVSHVKNKSLGAQISNPNTTSNTLGGLSFQTSGLGGSNIVTSATNGLRSGLNALLGNAAVNEAGSVLVTFGEPIWAIFKAIKDMSSTKIVTSQFMLTSNNYPAKFVTGQSRQVKTSAVVNSSGNGDVKGYETVSANLTVNITPQINHHNMINLTIDINDKDFLDHTLNSTDGNSAGKEIKTVACVANGEVLALGGMLSETNEGNQNGVPFLEKIPVLGWFFKSKSKSKNKSSYLVFISAKVLDENSEHQDVAQFTKNKVNDAQHYIDLVGHFESGDLSKDPINKAMFGEKHTTDLSTKTLVDEGELITPSVRFKQEKESKSHVMLKKDKPTRRERRMARKALKKQQALEKQSATVAVQTVMPQELSLPKELSKEEPQSSSAQSVASTASPTFGEYYYD